MPGLMKTYVLVDDDANFIKVAAQLKIDRYDAAIVVTEKPVGYKLAHDAGIPDRSGFHNGFAKPLKTLWLMTQLHRRVLRPVDDGRKHEAEAIFELGQPFVGDRLAMRDAKLLRRWLIDDGINADELVPAAPVGATRDIGVQIARKWVDYGGDEALPRLAALLGEYVVDHALENVRLLAAEAEADLLSTATNIFKRAFPGRANTVVPSVFSSLRPWVEAIAGLRLLLTPDTGAAHIAGMVGTPIIDMFPSGTPGALIERWRPWAAPAQCLEISAIVDGHLVVEALNALDSA